MDASTSTRTEPKLRVCGNTAIFDTEKDLEDFVWEKVLKKVHLTPLSRQFRCREGICDILAKGLDNQLIILELKNDHNARVIEQTIAYFDALTEEMPFAQEVDYAKPIEIWTICPEYRERIDLAQKYYNLKFNFLSFRLNKRDSSFTFLLKSITQDREVLEIDLPTSVLSPVQVEIPDSPKCFTDLLAKASDTDRKNLSALRHQVYHFSQGNRYQIKERVHNGKWVRFERNKSHPIVEIGWDKVRDKIAIYLWLPFKTINRNADRTSMIQIWTEDNMVQYVGYINNGRKSFLIYTPDELKTGNVQKPNKLKCGKWAGEARYWKGLAMPLEFYLNKMRISKKVVVLGDLVQLALEHALQKFSKSKIK